MEICPEKALAPTGKVNHSSDMSKITSYHMQSL